MKKIITILSFLILSYTSYTQTIPEYKGFVTDYENLFTAEQNAELTKILTDYEKETSIEIAILTVNNFESDISDFAQKTAEKWGIGKKGVNNGLLIIISKNKKILRTETGYGLEGYLPDGWLKLQGDSIVEKYFNNNIVNSTKKDTLEILNKATNILNSSKNWLNENVSDPELRGTLSEVGVINKNDVSKKVEFSDTSSRYFDGTKAYILACMNRIGKEYSQDKNSDLIKKSKETEKSNDGSIISWLLTLPWWAWILIIGIWFIIFLIDPGLAIQLLFLGMVKGGGSGSGFKGFSGGKFGGGGSSSSW